MDQLFADTRLWVVGGGAFSTYGWRKSGEGPKSESNECEEVNTNTYSNMHCQLFFVTILIKS